MPKQQQIGRTPRCPSCGAEGKCHAENIGDVFYEHYYVLWCDACGYVAANCGGYNPCPYCGVEGFRHDDSLLPDDVREVVWTCNKAGTFRGGILRPGRTNPVPIISS